MIEGLTYHNQIFIPAHPGYFVAEPVIEADVATSFVYIPIIAWGIEPISSRRSRGGGLEWLSPDVVPITVEGANKDSPIRLPFGEYCFPDEATFKSAEDALAYINEKQKRKDK